MEINEQELIERAQKGSREALGELASRYYEMVYAICLGVLRHREAARDVAQNVFIKLQREIKRFEGRSKFKTWLYRISVNASLDEVRKKKPAQSIDVTDASEDDDTAPIVMTDPSPGPHEQAAQQELRKILDKAIEELSPDHRSVLVLREWQDLSYEDIAEALDIEIGTVMSRLHYARKKLAEILKQHGHLDFLTAKAERKKS